MAAELGEVLKILPEMILILAFDYVLIEIYNNLLVILFPTGIMNLITSIGILIVIIGLTFIRPFLKITGS